MVQWLRTGRISYINGTCMNPHPPWGLHIIDESCETAHQAQCELVGCVLNRRPKNENRAQIRKHPKNKNHLGRCMEYAKEKNHLGNTPHSHQRQQ